MSCPRNPEGDAKMTFYEEKQGMAPWLHGLFAISILCSIGLLFWVGSGTVEGCVLAITGLLLLNLFHMRTEIRRDCVYVRLGLLFPMIWRRIPLQPIIEVREVQYRPLRDAGGWGFRYGRFEGKRCWYFTMRGDKGVLIVTRDQQRRIVGSQRPEALAQAVNKALRSL